MPSPFLDHNEAQPPRGEKDDRTVASDPERVARFEREAKAVAALQHPNIVTIHSVEKIEGRTCITMELVSGKTLGEKIDAEEFVARVLVQIPDPRRHLVRYYGAYSNRARGQRRKAEAQLGTHPTSEVSEATVPPTPERVALRRRWADLIRRVYETDPLVCPRCGRQMRVVSFITDPSVVRRIVDHLRKRDRVSRPPPPRVHQPAEAATGEPLQ